MVSDDADGSTAQDHIVRHRWHTGGCAKAQKSQDGVQGYPHHVSSCHYAVDGVSICRGVWSNIWSSGAPQFFTDKPNSMDSGTHVWPSARKCGNV